MKTLTATLLTLLLTFPTIVASQAPLRFAGGRFTVSKGDTLPPFTCHTYAGDEIDSDFFTGQVTLIQFASVWCTLSKSQLIDTNDFYLEMADNDRLSIIIFNEETNPADTTAFLARCQGDNLVLPIAYDPDERIYRMFATAGGTLTRTIVVDTDGRIALLSDIYYRKEFRHTKKKILKLLNRAAEKD